MHKIHSFCNNHFVTIVEVGFRQNDLDSFFKCWSFYFYKIFNIFLSIRNLVIFLCKNGIKRRLLNLFR